MTLEEYARDHLNPAMRELDPVGYREIEVDAAVRAYLERYFPSPGLQWDVCAAADRLGYVADSLCRGIRQAWREQHA